MTFCRLGLGVLPLAVVIFAGSAAVVSYVWAVLRDDVAPAFPFISDTGAKRPESCLFSLLMNLSAFTSWLTIYTRYLAIKDIAFEINEARWPRKLNQSSAFLGMVSALGICLVANFQDNGLLRIVHFVGASLAFVPGVMYCFLQTALSYHVIQVYPHLLSRGVCRVRLAITVACVVVGIIMGVSWPLASYLWSKEDHSADQFKWKPSDPGYVAHILSAATEWALVIGFFSFFCTFVREFSQLDFQVEMKYSGHPAPATPRPNATGARELNDPGHFASGSYNQLQANVNDLSDEPNERTRLLV